MKKYIHSLQSSVGGHQTPTKRREKRKKLNAQNPAGTIPKIRNCPGKKAARKQTLSLSLVNRCRICNVLFDSPNDKVLKKKHGVMNEYMGCDNEGCDYWVHVRCTDIVIQKKAEIKNHKFTCPLHKQ